MAAYSVYRTSNGRRLSGVRDEDKWNNQVIFSGTGAFIEVDKGPFMLEYIRAVSGGSLTLEDGEGNEIASGVTEFDACKSPIRCDYGLTITGNVEIAKGFVLPGVFTE